MAIRRTVRTHSLYCLRMLKRLGPLLIAATLLATGCAAEPIPESEKILIESSSSPLGPAAKDAKSKSKEAKPKTKRANVVVAEQAGIRLTAPRGWTNLSDGDVSYAASGPRAREFAERMNVSPEQFQSIMESTDVFLLGMNGTLNINRLPGVFALPSETEIRRQLSTLADVDEVRNVDTPLGDGLRVHYAIAGGGVQQHGAAVIVLVNGAAVQVTVTTRSADEAQSILARAIPTLKRA